MASSIPHLSLVVLLVAFCFHPTAISRKLDVEEEYWVVVAAKVGKESSTVRYAGLVEESGFLEAEDLSDRDEIVGFPDLEESTEELSEVAFPDSGENSEEVSADLGFPDVGGNKESLFEEQVSKELGFSDSDLEPAELEFHDDDGDEFHDDDGDDSSISSILDQNGLPIGLLPSSVDSYSLSGDGEFRVSLDMACYVKFDYEVYYAKTITGKLSYGAISDLSGIQAKEAFFWVPVTGIRVDIPNSSYIYFEVGPISKKLPVSQFEDIRDCKRKAMDSSALA